MPFISNTFTKPLLEWHFVDNKRVMPWKNEPDPYKIWLSEIILQQTRVEQGVGYYNRILEAYPSIKDLARAEEDEVYVLWKGLGYYSRCKNLMHTAKIIMDEYQGIFPNNYTEILKLKGVGKYTAAAISSFAFGLPYPVVDGNVVRVLARFFGLEADYSTTNGRKIFENQANKLIDINHPAQYNQAIMDFGATVCKPALPDCEACCLQKECFSFKNDLQKAFPVKKRKPALKERWFYFFLINCKGSFATEKRSDKNDIWQNLYQLPNIETYAAYSDEEVLEIFQKKFLLSEAYELVNKSSVIVQKLTHQKINGKFFTITIKKRSGGTDWGWIKSSKKNQYAFPKMIDNFIN